MPRDKEYRELEVEVIATTNKAARIVMETGDEFWVPFSLIEDNGENLKTGYQGKLYIENWFCEQEGIE